MYRQTKLKNGLRVVTCRLGHAQSVAIGIWIGTGGRHETKESAGISHFLEHILFDGTKKRSGIQIKKAVEGVGGALNGFTAEECTCFLAKMPAKFFRLGLDVLSDMVLNPKIDAKHLKKEKAVIAEEIRMYRDLPSHHVLELLQGLLWPGHPLGMNLAGTVETVQSINRRTLSDYMLNAYTGANIVVSVAGNVRHDDVVAAASSVFKRLPEGKRVAFRPARHRKDLGPINKFEVKTTEQTHLALGFKGVSALSPRRYAAKALQVILGGNMSSRLFQEVREKRGLAYAVAAHNKKYKDTGAFYITAGVKNKNAHKALEVIIAELKKVKQRGVKDDELKRAKQYLSGQLLLALEESSEYMLFSGEQLVCLDRILTPDEILKCISRIKKSEVVKFANDFFRRENASVSAIGPFDSAEKRKMKGALDIL